MVKIMYEPSNTLVIHDVVKVQLDDLLRERIMPAGTMPLYWCTGILFSFQSPPMVEEIVKEYINGKIHWMEVHYTEMKEYSEVLSLDDQHYGGTMKIRVIDTSKSPLHNDFIKWLKTNRNL
jgi:hypothetical protein